MTHACALEAIARAGPGLAVLVVAAHPDDETIGVGATLSSLASRGARVEVLHVTDGAPADASLRSSRLRDCSLAEVARIRVSELREALRAGGLDPDAVLATSLGIRDQEAALAMSSIAEQIASYLAKHPADVVVTHPYEGGHPDHDAVAFAVHAAVRRAGTGTMLAEMSSYNAERGTVVTAGFIARDGLGCSLTHEGALDDAARARKRAMLDAFTSQREVLRMFDTAAEPLRCAPAYDFTCAAHPGMLHYERLPFGWTGERWRAAAAAASGEMRAEEASRRGRG